MKKVPSPSPCRDRRDRRGGALALAAVMMVGLLAFMALVVDLGMAFTAHTEAQRVADAAALAGASAFIDFLDEAEAIEPAKERAKVYAAQNVVRNVLIDTLTIENSGNFFHGSELDIEVVPSEEKVRVWVRRGGLGVFFARLLGVDMLGVSAMAAAEARTGGSATCVWPMAVPDKWHDADDDTNGNGVPDPGEIWEYDEDAGDYYEQWNEDVEGTGYGENEFGRRMVIKSGPGSGGEGLLTIDGSSGGSGFIAPGNFMLWAMPDPDLDCNPGSGATWIKEAMTNCSACAVSTGTEYETEPGNTASVKDPVNTLMQQEPAVEWDDDLGVVLAGDRTPVESHPRIVTVALYDPTIYGDGSSDGGGRGGGRGGGMQGRSPIEFNNFAKVFIEGGAQPPDFAIVARFLGRVTGSEGPTTGSLVKFLRLVE